MIRDITDKQFIKITNIEDKELNIDISMWEIVGARATERIPHTRYIDNKISNKLLGRILNKNIEDTVRIKMIIDITIRYVIPMLLLIVRLGITYVSIDKKKKNNITNGKYLCIKLLYDSRNFFIFTYSK